MSDKPRVMGSGCFGGVVGAILGIVIGGFIGPLIATSNNELRNNPDPAAKQMSGIFDACSGFFGMVIGVAVGGIVGGIGGSVLGAGLAARGSTPPSEKPPSKDDACPAWLSEPPSESPDSELARLKERIAELEGKKKDEP